MKFLIIIPAHNEEQTIPYCLKSLSRQSFRNYQVIVVNDGSTDQTKELVEDFISDKQNFQLINLPKSEHEPGAKVVRTFNKALKEMDIEDFDAVCKFDADIIFPEDYLETISKIYQQNPNAGMVSGLVRIAQNNYGFRYDDSLLDFTDEKHWEFENISSKNHVRGPIKSYRTACFKSMNGLRPVLGWDNIDVMLAKKNGWEVVTVKDIWVKHLRPTAFKYKHEKAKKLGVYFYNIGLSFPLAAVSSAKAALKNGSVVDFFISMKSFLSHKEPTVLSAEEIKYIRNLRWSEMFRKFSR